MGTSTDPNDKTLALVPKSGDDLLPAASVVKVVTPLSIDERVANIERVLRDYIDNPPKLSDAEALAVRIAEVKGMAQSALDQVADLSDHLPNRVGLLESRVGDVERNVSSIATDKGVPLLEVVRDLAHENAHLRREWKCPACTCGTSDVIRVAGANSNAKTCPNCGKGMDVVRSVPVTADGQALDAA